MNTNDMTRDELTNSERAAIEILDLIGTSPISTDEVTAIIRREIPGCDARPDDWTEDDMNSVAYKRAQAITHGTGIKLTVDEFDRLFAQLKRSGDGL